MNDVPYQATTTHGRRGNVSELRMDGAMVVVNVQLLLPSLPLRMYLSGVNPKAIIHQCTNPQVRKSASSILIFHHALQLENSSGWGFCYSAGFTATTEYEHHENIEEAAVETIEGYDASRRNHQIPLTS